MITRRQLDEQAAALGLTFEIEGRGRLSVYRPPTTTAERQEERRRDIYGALDYANRTPLLFACRFTIMPSFCGADVAHEFRTDNLEFLDTRYWEFLDNAIVYAARAHNRGIVFATHLQTSEIIPFLEAQGWERVAAFTNPNTHRPVALYYKQLAAMTRD